MLDLGLRGMCIEKENNHVQETVKYCQENPQWRLSLQTHKIIGNE